MSSSLSLPHSDTSHKLNDFSRVLPRSGEVFPTATRAPYTSIGTYNTTLTSPTSVTSVKPAAGVKGMEARGALTLMMGCLGVVGGVLVL